MPRTAPKFYRSALAAAAALATFAVAPSSQAATMQLRPIVYSINVGITYTVASAGVGKLSIRGTDGTYLQGSDVTATAFATLTSNTFAIDAFFDLATGAVMKNYAGTSLLVTGERTAGNLETLYKATRLYDFDCVLNPAGTSSTFDFRWQKDANSGTFGNASPHPLLGTEVLSSSSLKNAAKTAGAFASQLTLKDSVAGYAANTPVNTVLFQSYTANGSANTYMTPTPEAFAGGAAAMAAGAVLRRRRREIAAD